MNVEITSKKANATTMTDEFGQFSLVCNEDDVMKVKPKAFKPIKKRVHADTESVQMNLHFIDSDENRKRKKPSQLWDGFCIFLH